MTGPSASAKLLVIACGALAREIVWLQTLNGWNQMDLQCLDAELHNRPKLIAQKLREKFSKTVPSMSIFLWPMPTAVLAERSIDC